MGFMRSLMRVARCGEKHSCRLGGHDDLLLRVQHVKRRHAYHPGWTLDTLSNKKKGILFSVPNRQHTHSVVGAVFLPKLVRRRASVEFDDRRCRCSKSRNTVVELNAGFGGRYSFMGNAPNLTTASSQQTAVPGNTKGKKTKSRPS